MKTINMYVENIFEGSFAAGNAKWGIVLEYISPEGKIAAKGYYGEIHNTTQNKAWLLTVITGFAKIKEPCNVHIYCASPYVAENLANDNVYAWRINEWKSRGVPIKNRELWEQVVGYLDIHNVTAEVSKYSKYRERMRNKMKGVANA